MSTNWKQALPGDPKWLKLAFGELGVKEIPGKKHSTIVLQYYKDVGHGWVSEDEVPWCGAFVGAMLVRGDEPIIAGALGARNWLQWGRATTLDRAKRGDVIVFKRGSGWQGHVAFFLKKVGNYVYVLDGNANNMVKISRRAIKGRYPVLGVRTPVSLNPLKTDSSRTARGGAVVATAGTAGGVATLLRDTGFQLREMSASDYVAILAVLFILAGTAWIMYARWSDWQNKAR